MNHEQQLQLQAYLDGELSDRDARKVTDLLASNDEARNLFAELQFTKTALVENEPEFKLPESREFFWSKIHRQIRQTEAVAARPKERSSIFGWLQRILVPTTSVALIALFAAILLNRSTNDSSLPLAMQFGEVETSSDAMGTMTFRSEAERMTVVWVYSRAGNSDVASDISTFNSYE